MNTRGRWTVRFEALQRMLMLRFLSRKLPLVLITEYPKSGGTWLAQLVSEMSGLPFPRNQRPKMESCIMHGHYLFSTNYYKPIVLFRDGRDIMVSAYYHLLFRNDHNYEWAVKMYREQLGFDDFDDIKSNLAKFIEFMFTKEKITWAQFAQNWSSGDFLMVKYEDLLVDCKKELLRIASHLEITPKNNLDEIVEKYSFKNQKAKSEASGKSFMRKGISGDWKNYFDKECRELFCHYAGNELISLGYEKDNSWVE